MSEEKIVEEALEAVRDAQKPGVFNLSEVIKGRGYPQKDVTVYIDGEAAFELVELEDKMKSLKEDSKEYAELEKQAEELAHKVQNSKLTFTLRGVSQSVVEAVTEKADKKFPRSTEDEYNSDWFKFYVTSLVAENLVKVTDKDGNVDEHHFTYEEVSEIRDNVPIESWTLLVNTMQKLTLATGYFKGLTDAGFLPKS